MEKSLRTEISFSQNRHIDYIIYAAMFCPIWCNDLNSQILLHRPLPHSLLHLTILSVITYPNWRFAVEAIVRLLKKIRG